jgi:hypothetical protein
LRLPRLRRKHGLRRQNIQVPGQVSTGLARNLGASPLRWFRQTIGKGDQSELTSGRSRDHDCSQPPGGANSPSLTK